jgi:hypothetical protein
MRLDRIGVPIFACAALSGCGPDIGFDLQYEPDPECISPAQRTGRSVTVGGTVRDHVTGEPVAGAEVDFNTAWDVLDEFPAGCAPISTFTAAADGRFGPQTVDVDSPGTRLVALFLVRGEGLAATASDQTLTCEQADCEAIDHTIAAPTRELADRWRRELERGGMPDVANRGLVLFQFREPDGGPAEGVVPHHVASDSLLVPDVQVRFFEPDRVTLAPPGTAATTAAGLAIIALDEEYTADYIFGERGEDFWDITGVLGPPGWIFLEGQHRSVPDPTGE